MPQGKWAMSESAERVFPASKRRRQLLRQQGDVASASWLSSAVSFAVALWLIEAWGAAWWAEWQQVLHQELQRGWSSELTGNGVWLRLLSLARTLGKTVLPLVLLPWGAAIGVRLCQTRLLFTWSPLRPDWSRLGFPGGWGRLFGMGWGSSLGRGIIQLAVTAGLAWGVIHALDLRLLALESGNSASSVVEGFLGFVRSPIHILGVGVVIVGLADLAWQVIAYERRIRMTSEEVREEIRQSERQKPHRPATGNLSATPDVPGLGG